MDKFSVTDDASGDEILRFDDDFVYERGVRVEAPMGGVQFLNRSCAEALRNWLTEWLNAPP